MGGKIKGRVDDVKLWMTPKAYAIAMTSSEESQVLVFFTVLAPDDFRRFKKFPIPYDNAVIIATML